MNPHLVCVFLAIVLPFAAANYGSSGAYSGGNDGGNGGSYDGGVGGYASSNSHGVEDVINVAGYQQPHSGASSISTPADVGAGHGAQPGLAHANAQLHGLNANTNYQNLKNSDVIAESLAEKSLANSMQQGRVDIVAPNVVGQTAFRSLLVPNGPNAHQVTATQPLQPIVVNQPGAPPAQISSGPPAVVRAAPIVYKLKPSVIYQQEVINKIPPALSLNPVYVKVYKSEKQVDAPIGHAYAPSYGGSSYGSASHGGGSYGSGSHGGSSYGSGLSSNDGGHASSHYGSAAAPSASYGGHSGY